jgi:hypothetical protein
MKNNTGLIILGVLVVVALVYLGFKPKQNTNTTPTGQTTTIGNPNGADYTPSVSTVLPTPYISEQANWPPAPKDTSAAYVCKTGISETKQTVEKEINGRKYCVTDVYDGAAGSVYHTYTYMTALPTGTRTATFTLRYQNCGVYDETQISQCHTAQNTFNLDVIVDNLMNK